jgi:hypothetical protein
MSMRTGYAVIFALFMFSLMSNVIFEMGIFPNTGLVEVGIGTAEINELDTSIEGLYSTDLTVEDGDEDISIFGGIEMLLKSGAIVLKSVGYTVLIYPLLVNYGLPAVLSGAIQGIVTLTEGFYLVEFITNRRLSQ